jgi:hypothetical protein
MCDPLFTESARSRPIIKTRRISMSNIHVTPGSLYIARFAQASAPHVGLIRVIPAALRAASFTLTATCHPFEHTNAAFSASRATYSPHPAWLQVRTIFRNVSRGCWQWGRSHIIWNLGSWMMLNRCNTNSCVLRRGTRPMLRGINFPNVAVSQFCQSAE